MTALLIVGAGFSGAVLARALAESGFDIHVIDAADVVGGHCHTARDTATGVMEHVYGPHIFHTSNDTVWRYLQRFGEWVPFINRVKACTVRGVFGLPINLHTINQFFNRSMRPDEARDFVAALSDANIDQPANLEEQALKFIGRDLYEAFFRGYTIKQWGCDPTELPADILKRLPVRFHYDDNYYDSIHQALPKHGYTRVIENILDHTRIRVQLATRCDASMQSGFAHVFHAGALDAYFGFGDGRLGYRTMHWQREVHDGDYQGTAIINYPELDVPWTRIIEHQHFAPWEQHQRTLVTREFSRETAANDLPFYPKRLAVDLALLARYVESAQNLRGITFIGRLGTYRYLDMHQVIADALALAHDWCAAYARSDTLPLFSRSPL
ncbi:MAG: NAD(P)-binding protein [Rhodanobacteraceae bacterium]|jgi:UDP-galactopyranose mutase|nr:NAD(P)-binding protein [Rhodanobacteraceae bacterium]MBK7042929.1 NAD(P)-binding protein [Rhodanobacteraceae bacterium]MBP9153737.1 NAD(P)-binding protein [Xanthomonadales bacterium]HQW81789.1 UDP-galactopyranose mutase [Pseudomonadota bacterium]